MSEDDITVYSIEKQVDNLAITHLCIATIYISTEEIDFN